MGLLFLIIYGNLSGNLGWSPTSTTYTNESSTLYKLNSTAFTLTNGISTTGYISLSVTNVWNITDTVVLIPAANYTVDSTAGTVTNATDPNWSSIDVNVSYVVTHRGTSELNTEAVIGNLTSGATQFFTFSDVWFILTAITILIGIVLGVIALVQRGSGGGFAGKESRSKFVS